MHDTLPDHYATLGLHRGCTPEDIKSAFRILSKAHHPDVNGASPEAMTRIQLINAAYHALGDPARRAEYDAERAQHEAKRPARAAIPPIKQELLLSAMELFQGAERTIEVRDPGHPDGFESYPLTIPPDTAPGTRFRIQRHAPFATGRIEVHVKLRPDRQFKARGSDLRCDLRINSRRAETGGQESLRSITGKPIMLAIPAKVARGEMLRVRGEGLPKPRGGRGDLLVRIMYRPEVRFTRGDTTRARPQRRLLR